MRFISSKELPNGIYGNILIKSTLITRHRNMASALERTLSHCNKIRIECESRLIETRENCEKEGYSSGLQLFFTQLMNMLDDYEVQQNTRMASFEQSVIDAVQKSFDDMVIVERIIHHIKINCCQQNIKKIIVPRTVQLPDSVEMPNYQYTDDKHITVESEKEAIRFQSAPLCRQWLIHAENKMANINKDISKIIPDIFIDMGMTLVKLGEENRNKPRPTTLSEENNDIT
ncbi:conserved uncharacterized protein [Erwinia sp. Ejp617]|nr:hypothetical protein [Erwinia sp. Ejp617]ADP12400.1 conserved uncharacterized protein [Erwinia sp. Ejp617]